MAKLKKRISSSPVSKRIPVEDVNGNKHILKATVVSVDPTSKSQSSDEITDDTLITLGLNGRIISPPLSQEQLVLLQENSSELGQIIDAMITGVAGFGGRVHLREMKDSAKEVHASLIAEEQEYLETFFKFPNPEGSFKKLIKESLEDYESTGNMYWELIPTVTRSGRFSCINKLDVSTMRLTKLDQNFTRYSVKYVDRNFQLKNKYFVKKFRRFVQVVNNKKMFFKEFGDPRIIDKRTGDVIDAMVPQKYWANEVWHRRLYTPRRSPYGLPRFTGNIIAIRGSRSADETNILTQQNNHVPSMAVMVAGGQLTQASCDRLQDFVDTQIKSNANYSKFLILEGESDHDSLSGSGSMKIEIQPLSNNQHQDQLWQEYDKSNSEKLRRSFRIPPILVGKGEDYSKATATVSERLAERYVFSPEREELDEEINKLLVQQGFRFCVWKSHSPNVTDDQDLVRILTGAERTGGLTPRISRMLLEDILNRKLPPFPEDVEDFNPDLPFSYTLAKLMHEAGAANQNGSFASQGQTPKAPGSPGRPSAKNLTTKTFDPVSWMHGILEGMEGADENQLEELKQNLEDSLDTEAFGKPDREFFAHEH